MKISLITPTSERPQLLKQLYQIILNQDFSGEWEWLIDDDSWKPSQFLKELKDPRIKYFYNETPCTIGEKRTRLNAEAKGEIIIHLDDDDYYAPHYFSRVYAILKEVDFFNIHSWFCYSVLDKQFYYWATDHLLERHFELNPHYESITEVEFTEEWKEIRKERFIYLNKHGYGFSYAYRNEVGKKCPFLALNAGEDFLFYESVMRSGYTQCQLPDEEGLVVHINHDMNTSLVFPQYRIPSFLIKNLFKNDLSFFYRYPTREEWIC